ncbi:18047_t:CDS:2, partial [Acaulospora morrowiae]
MRRTVLSFLALILLTLSSFVTSNNPLSGHRRNFGPKLHHRKYEAPSIINEGTLSDFSTEDPLEIAIKFVSTKLHPTADFVIKDSYKSDHNGVTHIYFKQIVNGLFVSNGDLNVNVDQFGRVISYGDSFYVPNPTIREQNLRPDEKPNLGNVFDDSQYVFALESFARFINKEIAHPEDIKTIEHSTFDDGHHVLLLSNVPFALSDVKMSQEYIQMDDRSLRFVWDIQIEMEDNWYNAQLDAHTGKVVSLIDWVSDAAYNVFPFGTNDPSDGDRKLLLDPHDILASPNGWHTQGKKNFNNTIGNNVYAHENLRG